MKWKVTFVLRHQNENNELITDTAHITWASKPIEVSSEFDHILLVSIGFFDKWEWNTRRAEEEIYRRKKQEKIASRWAYIPVQICGVDLLITMCSCEIEICHNCLVIYWIKWTKPPPPPPTKPHTHSFSTIAMNLWERKRRCRARAGERKIDERNNLINEESSHVSSGSLASNPILINSNWAASYVRRTVHWA